MVLSITEDKECTMCGDTYPNTEEFYPPYRRGKPVLRPWCRDCTSLYTVNKQKPKSEQLSLDMLSKIIRQRIGAIR